MAAGERIRFRDVKPYCRPQRLSDLCGPYEGRIRLRHAVRWAPGDGVIDLGSDGGVRLAYQALLSEGKVDDQIRGMNKRRLIEIWPFLHLDSRIRDAWENDFPELRTRRDASAPRKRG